MLLHFSSKIRLPPDQGRRCRQGELLVIIALGVPKICDKISDVNRCFGLVSSYCFWVVIGIDVVVVCAGVGTLFAVEVGGTASVAFTLVL